MARTTKVEHPKLITRADILPFLHSQITDRHLCHAHRDEADMPYVRIIRLHVDQCTGNGDGEVRLGADYGAMGGTFRKIGIICRRAFVRHPGKSAPLIISNSLMVPSMGICQRGQSGAWSYA